VSERENDLSQQAKPSPREAQQRFPYLKSYHLPTLVRLAKTRAVLPAKQQGFKISAAYLPLKQRGLLRCEGNL
jgi:hypothetical protein